MFMNTEVQPMDKGDTKSFKSRENYLFSWALGLLVAYNTVEYKHMYGHSVGKFKAQWRYGIGT